MVLATPNTSTSRRKVPTFASMVTGVSFSVICPIWRSTFSRIALPRMSSCSTWMRFLTFQSTILSFRMGLTALLSWMSTLAVAL
jgi:hypothetical protein